MKFGNLNFLEPSGPLQACNGTALPFFLLLLLTAFELSLGGSSPYTNSFSFLGKFENYNKRLLASSYLSFFRPSVRMESLDSN